MIYRVDQLAQLVKFRVGKRPGHASLYRVILRGVKTMLRSVLGMLMRASLRYLGRSPIDAPSTEIPEVLLYIEGMTSTTLGVVRSTYDALHDRVNKLATLLVGGAGGVGAYALGKSGVTDALPQAVALGCLSLWWFGIAAYLLLVGASSLEMSPGSTFAGISTRYNEHLKTMSGSDVGSAAFVRVRWEQLAAVDQQIEAYRTGVTLRAKVLDAAYTAAVLSPLVGCLGLFSAYWLI